MSWIAAALLGAAIGAPESVAQAPAAAQGEAKPTTGKVGEMIPAATAKLMRGGKEATLDTQKAGKITAYFLVGVTCPATAHYSERLCALEKAYMGQGVDFVYVYVNKPESAEMKAKFHKEQKFQGAFWNDADCSFVKSIKASKTGEVLIVDKEGKVAYRGGIDDNLQDPSKVKSKFVASALDEMLAGKQVTKTTGSVFG
jgi:hypothetical protein